MEQIQIKTVLLKDVFTSQYANWVISVSHKACILLFVASATAIFIRWSEIPAQVPLWYAKPWGVERLASPIWLFMLPLGSFGWYIVNTITAIFVTRDYLVFTQLLYITSSLISIMSFVTLTKILLIVT